MSLAAWAWGFHRTVDYLLTQSYTDKEKICVTGWSRGGKAAIVAPRAYLCTNGLKDTWANPRGTAQAHLAAWEVFASLGAENKMGIFYANSGHDHKIDKWIALLDFADMIFYGKKAAYDYNSIPFPNLEKAFSWSRPVLSSSVF